MSEVVARLSGWVMLDTWIVVTGALAAMACAVPGVFLVLRRQSLMGDALSHTVLLGVVGAYLVSGWMRHQGWLSAGHGPSHAALFLGAVLVGVASAALTESVQRIGRVEPGAALGVVFTTLFALGLLLIRAVADDVHIDPDCVLYGAIETVALGEDGIPRATLVNGGALVLNLVLVAAFFKELRITTFDPSLADTLGISSRAVGYALAAVTAATLTAAFESVGSILVIAMLIVPAATATLLCESLGRVLAAALVLAALGAVLGHAMALTLPALIFRRLGFSEVNDASTAGMMAFASGLLFVLTMLFGPRTGVVSRLWHGWRLGLRIVREDILGLLFRLEERAAGRAMGRAGDDDPSGKATATAPVADGGCPRDELLRLMAGRGPILARLALWRSRRRDEVNLDDGRLRLTARGRAAAAGLVRAHRLWETYLARHFPLPGDHLHEPAERVEHYLDPALRHELAAELDEPPNDPHGASIPRGDAPSTT